ncbi:DUF7837 family putative zinc-binding protein [Halalkalirubrum salinum]
MAPEPQPTILDPGPHCGVDIKVRHVIIRYETESGEPRSWVGCPACDAIVDPKANAQ